MTQPSPDAQAIVRICEQLTTQVRRIADALSTPLATTDEGRSPLAEWRRAWDARPTGADVSDLVEIGPAADEDALRAARRASLRALFSRVHRSLPLTLAEVRLVVDQAEAEMREADTARAIAAGNKRHVQTLIPEMDRLAQENEQLRAGRDQARATIERMKRTTRMVNGAAQQARARAERAQAAVDRVRALHTRTTMQTTAGPMDVCTSCENDSMSYPWPCPTAEILDGTEQPNT